jgi:predicted RNA-binding protein associated with RNAse of E/G family
VWRPCRFGFDTEDHALHIWIETDGSWQWKDEHELEVGVEVGFFSPEQAAAFRAEGERVIAEWPFPTGWEHWRADPSWPIPSVPAEWEAQ